MRATEVHIPMRLLGAGRLSHKTDETTSPERQKESWHLTAKVRGDRVVAEAMDLDVSGAVSPFKRPELGPYLTDPDLIGTWDGLIVAKLDRLSRSILDFQLLLQWCDKHNKIIISVSEGFDLGTTWGRMVANMLMIFAQFERERIAERRTEAAEKLRASGKWNGGRVPYGYMTKDGGTGLLYQNPDTAPVARRIVNWIIDGGTRYRICEMLTEEGVPTPRGAARWEEAALEKMLTSRYLLGELLYKRRPVLDDDGLPIMITDDPLITEDEWGLLQSRLLASRRPRGSVYTTHLLTRVAYCNECDAPMYHQHNGGRNYYRCHGRHGAPAIRAEVLETFMVDHMLNKHGAAMIQRRVGAGRDYQSELDTALRELGELEDQYLQHNLSAQRFASMSTKYESRIAELHILAENADGARWEDTGETVAQRWDKLNPEGRNDMLLRLGARMVTRRVYRVSDRSWRWDITAWFAADAHERLLPA